MSVSNEKDPGKNGESIGPERRHNLRFPFSASVEVTEPKSGARIAGRTSDLGLGGCYVDAISPLPVGTNALLKIKRDTETFEAQVRVVYSQLGMGMGLAFVSAQPKQVKVFQRWIQEIGGEPRPKPGLQDPDQEKQKTDGVVQEDHNYVLSELLITLIRKEVLTEAEGKEMLKKLHR